MSFKQDTFKLNLISLGVALAMAQQANYVYAQAADESATEEVIVTGIRAAEKNAIDIKRNAGSVVDAITATDIGKLPDSTVSDSLQRIPGVQIERSGGEGAKVNIRGQSSVTTTLNGEQMLSAGSITTLQPDFSDIPATMVSGLEVYKSSEAKNVVSGLAGTINLKTNRPFSLKSGLLLQGKAEASEGSYGKTTDPNLSAFVGYNDDGEWGASLSVAHSKSNLANYYAGWSNEKSAGDWTFTPGDLKGFVSPALDVNGDGDTSDVYMVPEGHTAQNQFIDRQRDSFNASFQYKINDTLTATADAMYTKLNEHVYTEGFTIEENWQAETGWVTPLSAQAHPLYVPHDNGPNTLSTDPNANLYTVTNGIWQARSASSRSETKASQKEALNTNLELDYDSGANLKGKLRWVHGKGINNMEDSQIDARIDSGVQSGRFYRGIAKNPDGSNVIISSANPFGYDGVWATLPNGQPVENSYKVLPVGVNYYKGKQIWALPMLATLDGTSTEVMGSNMNRYIAQSSNLSGTYSNADLNVFRLDASYDFDDNLWGVIKSVDAGVRSGRRHVEKNGWIGGLAGTNNYGDAYLVRWQDTAVGAPETGESVIDPNKVSFAALNALGMVKSVSDFRGTSGLSSIWVVNPKAMNNPIAWQDQIYGTHVLTPDAGNTYDLTDTTNSFYVQMNLDSDLMGVKYRGNLGLRYIETQYDTTQSIALPGTVATFNGRSYILGLGMVQPDGDKLKTPYKYSDILPTINLAFDITDDQVLRFSASKTVGTHDTDQIGGGLSVNRAPTCGVRVNGAEVSCAISGNQLGNPTLAPNRMQTMDLSYEWYFSPSSMVSIGAFRQKSENSIVTTTINRTDIVDSDGVVRGYNVNTQSFTGVVPINSIVNQNISGSPKTGWESSYKQSFDFLSGFWSAFGLDASYTYSPGNSSQTDYYGNTISAQGASRNQYNLALWYEKDGLEMRIAKNFRSRSVFEITDATHIHTVAYTEAASYIDASINYKVDDYVTVSFQGNNLTETKSSEYLQWSDVPMGSYYNERRLTLGVQVKY